MPKEPERAGIVLVSCYELGHQPLALATPLALLRRAGARADAYDLSIDSIGEDAVREAHTMAIAVPMHTALRLGIRLARRARELNPSLRIGFFGLYAALNRELLLEVGASAVLAGEADDALVGWLLDADHERLTPAPLLARPHLPVPERSTLPALDRYAHLRRSDGHLDKVGAVEASRGCKHLCRHCPIPPVYGGRFFVVPQETVLGDVQQLVDAGARHINFTDPDFLNGPRHALDLIDALHREHPELTFDFTAKVEHLLKYSDELPALAAKGCAFIVSAIESLSDRVLQELDKGHSADDAQEALERVRDAGIALKPTFVAFTPWTERSDYRELLTWIRDQDLVDDVEPIQLTLRLLLPAGTLLLANRGLAPSLGPLDTEALTYRWTHPDPSMDELQRVVTQRVTAALADGREGREIFAEVCGLAEVDGPRPSERGPTPRLTEAWFC